MSNCQLLSVQKEWWYRWFRLKNMNYGHTKCTCFPFSKNYVPFNAAQWFRVLVAELSVCSVGECYLTDWTVWSPCQLSCVSGDDLGFGSVQVRSRAVLAQDPENLLQCPEQELEARPCTGQSGRVLLELKMTLKSFTEAYYRSACCSYSRGHFSP